MEHLEFYDWIGPLITSLAAIIALSGESFKKNVSWYKKLNWRGYSIAFLIMISVIISIINTNTTKSENRANLRTEQDRFDSLKIKLAAVTKSKDSLTAIIKKLDEDFVAATLNELKEQRRILDENRKRILQNAIQEVIYNIRVIEDLENLGQPNLDSMHLPVSTFSNSMLKDSKSILLNGNLQLGIDLIIKRVESINIGLELIKSGNQKSVPSNNNIKTIFSMLPELKKNLKTVYRELKTMIPDYKIEFIKNGKVEKW